MHAFRAQVERERRTAGSCYALRSHTNNTEHIKQQQQLPLFQFVQRERGNVPVHRQQKQCTPCLQHPLQVELLPPCCCSAKRSSFAHSTVKLEDHIRCCYMQLSIVIISHINFEHYTPNCPTSLHKCFLFVCFLGLIQYILQNVNL